MPNALGYLSITDRGRKALLRKENEEFLKMQRAELREKTYTEKLQSKFDIAKYKQERNAYYKEKAQMKQIDDKLKSRYGLVKQKSKKKEYNYFKGFNKYNKTIASSKIIPGNVQSQFNARPLTQQKKWNPFAHKSEMEVYGDEGLTLFDGNKMDDDDTGALFGFGGR